jgi:hypothetical protein
MGHERHMVLLVVFFIIILTILTKCFCTSTQDVATLALGESLRECEDEDSHSQVSSNVGSWSPVGLPNLQRAIIEVKTPHIEKFFISLENYQSVNVYNGLA